MKWVVKNAVRRVKFMLMIVNCAKNNSSCSSPSCSCFSSQFLFYVFFLLCIYSCRYFYITSRMFNGFNAAAALLVILGATWAAKWQGAGGQRRASGVMSQAAG